jgi:hypothetical protein
VTEEMFAPIGSTDETNVLAVRFHRSAEAEPSRMRPNFFFCHVADRKTRVRKCRCRHHMQHIALVLSKIGSTFEPQPAITMNANASMVSRRNRIKTKFICSFCKPFEFEMTIAFNTRVWRDALLVGVDVGLDDMLIEFVREVKDDVFNSDLLSNTPCIVDIGHAAASRVAFTAPQSHRDTDDIVALFVQ